jgi:hypothetical protein
MLHIDDRKSAIAFICGLTVATLFYFQPAWCELAILCILLLFFRKALVRLICNLRLDLESWNIERRLSESVHFDADARTAFEFFARK